MQQAKLSHCYPERGGGLLLLLRLVNLLCCPHGGIKNPATVRGWYGGNTPTGKPFHTSCIHNDILHIIQHDNLLAQTQQYNTIITSEILYIIHALYHMLKSLLPPTTLYIHTRLPCWRRGVRCDDHGYSNTFPPFFFGECEQIARTALLFCCSCFKYYISRSFSVCSTHTYIYIYDRISARGGSRPLCMMHPGSNIIHKFRT